ncbi:MAG: SpoVA/SpoVAEb family sporulation membrane protein [Christensenellales bacterium]|jgi:stage V sporulation protein AE
METLIKYLIVFLVGGFICLIGQILIIKTKITAARILLLFLLSGVVFQTIGIYEPISEFAKAGINVPIVGFGASIAKGAINAVKSKGLIGILSGGLTATAAGISAAVFFAFIFAIIFRSRTKKD